MSIDKKKLNASNKTKQMNALKSAAAKAGVGKKKSPLTKSQVASVKSAPKLNKSNTTSRQNALKSAAAKVGATKSITKRDSNTIRNATSAKSALISRVKKEESKKLNKKR